MSLTETFKAFGAFEPALGPNFKTTQDFVDEALTVESRPETPPPAVRQWECRIGGSRFFVPPINISVNQSFSAGTAIGALRQTSPPRFNSGHSETVIGMTLYFPSHDSIWGFDGDRLTIDFDKDEDAIVDKFMGSLRGLVAQFKYAPFLPVKNLYLNSVYNVTAVALRSLTISTLPNFPFVLVAQLNMMKFNHKVYMPMVENLDDAIHWGRFRQYIGRAAKKMQEISTKSFLTPDVPTLPESRQIPRNVLTPEDQAALIAENRAARFGNTTMFDKDAEYFAGQSIELFYPDHDPARVIGPDLGFWRDENHGTESWWQAVTKYIGINPDGIAAYANVLNYKDAVVAGNEYRLLASWMNRVAITYTQMSPSKMNEYIESRITSDLPPNASQESKDAVRNTAMQAWYTRIYQSFLDDPQLQRALAFQQFARGQVQINEWEVPMRNLGLNNPNVVVNNVSVTMANNIVPLQLSMQDEPTYQHVGGLGSNIDISMTVFGEEDIARIRLMFDTISGLALLEHGHSVLGFLGIKNIITALCGVKYCVPQSYSVDTVPNMPHVYNVQLSFLDFDVFQQKREILSSEQQAELKEAFSKKNPFLRIKQLWGAFNAYPDFPLSVRDTAGKIKGHYDPDYYFRAFKTLDDDIVNWRQKVPQTQGQRENQSLDQIKIQSGQEYEVVQHFANLSSTGAAQSMGLHARGFDLLSAGQAVAQNCNYNEPHPGNTQLTPFVPGCTPGAGHAAPYFDGSDNPDTQFDAMMADHQYRDKTGRMIRAFPTFMLWLIDEGGTFAGVKMFDNFYGLQSIIDMSVVQSEDCMADTLIIRISNLYSRLSTQYKDLLDERIFANAKIINTQLNRTRNLLSGFSNYLVELETINLQPGVRLHLRMGYSANPNKLDTVFNGTVTKVDQGEIITITAQSDCIELSPIVNNKNKSGNTGKIDGSLMSGFWMSEPRDLMTRLLSMGGSTFRETLAHATHGMIYSENRFGIRHFGSLLYEPMTTGEKNLSAAREAKMKEAASGWKDFFNLGGPLGSVANFISAGVGNIITGFWVNFNRKRDYELYKRNIYPGNGTGVAQYMGGDLGDGGVANAFMPTGLTDAGLPGTDPVTGQTPIPDPRTVLKDTKSAQKPPQYSTGFRLMNPDGKSDTLREPHPFLKMLGITNEVGDDDLRGFDEVSFRAQTYMKSVWDLFMVCAALLPNYIVAVRPFEHRSTVFYGKPHWMYTSGVIPLSKGVKIGDPNGPKEIEPNADNETKFLRDIENEQKKTESPSAFYDRLTNMSEEQFKGIRAQQTSGGDPTGTLAGMPWGGGDISALPLTQDNGTIPTRTGKITQEMHLPAAGESVTAKTGHKQLAELPANLKWPYYMDRIGGPAGGYTSAVGDVSTGTRLGENPNTAGKSGAFGILPPDAEQWYMNMRWPTGNGYPGSIRGKKIMVYNERTKKGVICTPGDWGPASSTGLVAGLSPDTVFALAAKQGDVCWFGFVPVGTALGPVNFTSAAQFKGSGLPATGGSSGGVVGAIANVAATAANAVLPGSPIPTTSDAPSWMNDSRAKGLSPAQYSLQWGWDDKDVPVNYTDPKYNLTDQTGVGAAEVYKGQRSDAEANEIWDEFRDHFKSDPATENEFKKAYPNSAARYNEIVQNFQKFMWTNAYHRGWVVLTADAAFTLGTSITGDAAQGAGGIPIVGDTAQGAIEGVGDTIDSARNIGSKVWNQITPWGGDHNDQRNIRPYKWDFDRAHALFAQYITNGPTSAIEWMKSHTTPGKDATGLIGRGIEEFKTKIWDNLMEFFKKIRKAVGSVMTGIVSLMRMSIMTLTGGLSMSAYAGRQANLLNRVFNDSIYFQAGPPGSLLYYADNPFTREFGEPVVEIRQPFQRIHHFDSFDHIINNGIQENGEDVATVITATSNGKHPVTVHFDKGAPTEKQIEKSVETGLFWDTPGLLGKITHPIESMRSFATHFNNGDQETSAKRAALWYLKENLKDIYGGEIMILGDPSVRPHDLVNIGDVYNRIYGMCEVEQVVHHFTPETGFVTSITPNAIVTINDPARWQVGSLIRKQYAVHSLRRELRQQLGIRTGGARIFGVPSEQNAKEFLVKRADSALLGSVQYHGGLSAILKDVGGMAGIGGITGGGAAVAAGGGALAIGGGGLLGGFLGWEAFKWVRDNLLDAHGCYIQYLNKNGRPMDAGLSYNHGVAVGQVHAFRFLGDAIRIPYRIDGNYTITSNDLFKNLGWSEYQIEELQSKDIDMWTDKINKDILKLSGREQEAPLLMKPQVYMVEVLSVKRGDLITVQPSIGGRNHVKLKFVHAPAGKSFEEGGIDASAPAELARQFGVDQLLDGPAEDGYSPPVVAVRVDPTNQTDQFGNVLGTIFHNVPPSTPPDKRAEVLKAAAEDWPSVRWDSYLGDGRAYTFNWALCIAGFGDIDMSQVNRTIPGQGVIGTGQ